MRPGQVRPGIPGVLEGPPGGDLFASMRPGQVRPGIPGGTADGRTPGTRGFNEAGAGSPRNTRSDCWQPSHSPRGFNEAGAGSPRNTPAAPGRLAPGYRASMRPGQVRPGILGELRKIEPGNGLASMRPGQVRPGIQGIVHESTRGLDASMRPGQVRPGIREIARAQNRLHVSLQ